MFKVALRGFGAASILIAVITIADGRTNVPVAAAAPAETEERVPVGGSALGTSGQPVRIKSLLNVRKRLKHGEYVWQEEGVAEGPVLVAVNLETQTLSVFRDGHEIGTSVILYGAHEKPTPLGEFSVKTKLEHHRSSTYGAPMPYTLRLTDDGVAIHGSDVKWGRATHGCIGVPTKFAALLFKQVKVGDKVLVERRRFEERGSA